MPVFSSGCIPFSGGRQRLEHSFMLVPLDILVVYSLVRESPIPK